jgi:hypothetical protein
MAALTALMAFEKTGKEGRRGVPPIGFGLLILGTPCSPARPPDGWCS